MRIRKVKFDGQRVEILYEQEKDIGMDEYSLKCTDKPLETFVNALDALRPAVAELCELPMKWGENLEVRGVSFSYEGDQEVMGAVISALKPLANSSCPLVINTPHACEEPPSPTAEANLLPEKAVEALKAVISQAKKYIAGERDTVPLFKGEEKDSSMTLSYTASTSLFQYKMSLKEGTVSNAA